mmetsp:Transcript_28697/g.78939  ORF Transcript_28697/g.78939 Transcript_28697/m.78939 type:complete len:612 (+) Transcript_28697:106-1941(+)
MKTPPTAVGAAFTLPWGWLVLSVAELRAVAGLDADSVSWAPALSPVGHLAGLLHEVESVVSHGPPELLPASGEIRTYTTAMGLEFAPMTTLMCCISCLAGPYFVAHALLVMLRHRERHPGAGEPSSLRRTLESTEPVLSFSPMLCVLFLAAQMQAMHLSRGHDDPAPWVRACMQVASGTLIAQLALAIAVPLLTGAALDADEDAVLVDGPGNLTRVVSCLLMLVRCGACGGICTSLLEMQGPAGSPDAGISPAVACTLNLTLQFFAVHLLLAAVLNATSHVANHSSNKLLRVLKVAANTVFFAPMLCALFIGARVRAKQVNPDHGWPQPWAQFAFHLCSYALLLQTLLVVVVPFLPGGDARRGTEFMKGDVEIAFKSCERGAAAVGFSFLRFLPCLMLFGGVAAVIVSMFTASSPAGLETPGMPPTMLCLTILAVEFFGVCLGLWVLIAVRSLIRALHDDRSAGPKVLIRAMRLASSTVRFCPMLAVLFVTLRLRAQQITGDTGTPQGWAQEAMYLSTAAVSVQLLVSLFVGLAVGEQSTADAAMRSSMPAGDEKATPSIVKKSALVVQVLSSVVLFGGAVVVCVALFVITPSSAGGRGRLLASTPLQSLQ